MCLRSTDTVKDALQTLAKHSIVSAPVTKEEESGLDDVLGEEVQR